MRGELAAGMPAALGVAETLKRKQTAAGCLFAFQRFCRAEPPLRGGFAARAITPNKSSAAC